MPYLLHIKVMVLPLTHSLTLNNQEHMKNVTISFRNTQYLIEALTSSAMGSICRFVLQNSMTEGQLYKLAKKHPNFYSVSKV